MLDILLYLFFVIKQVQFELFIILSFFNISGIVI